MRKYFPALLLLLVFCNETNSQTLQDLGLTPLHAKNCTSVKDQYMSSTCWSFASLSLIESELIKQGKGEFDLSEMFVARYSMLRKIQLHLKLKGSNYFTPGGQFHDVAWVIKNHGMVPESAYPGLTEGRLKHNHSELDTLLTHYVNQLVADGITLLNLKQENYIDSLLDHYLGKVPLEFNYKGTVYAPFSFAERVLRINPTDYVEITSYTHHPFYTSFILEDKYNWTSDHYYNVPLQDFCRITNEALGKGYTVEWDGDADDPNFDFGLGIASLVLKDTLDQQNRQADFKSGVTTLDHMMHIIGMEKDNEGKNWYYIKNSWGTDFNSLYGFLFMSEDYFKFRTVAIIVNKMAIPTDIRKKMGI